MTTKIDAEQAAEQLPELLLRIRNGERFLIEHEGTPIAAIIPANDLQEQRPQKETNGRLLTDDPNLHP